MSPSATTFNEDDASAPLDKGGLAGGFEWVVRSAFSNPPRQPPKGFTTSVVSPSFPLW